MIRKFQSSPFLIFPEDKLFKNYAIKITTLLLSAAFVTAAILLTPGHFAIAAFAALAFLMVAPVLIGYNNSLSYNKLESEAHDLRTSLRGFFTKKNVVEPIVATDLENASSRLLA